MKDIKYKNTTLAHLAQKLSLLFIVCIYEIYQYLFYVR